MTDRELKRERAHLDRITALEGALRDLVRNHDESVAAGSPVARERWLASRRGRGLPDEAPHWTTARAALQNTPEGDPR